MKADRHLREGFFSSIKYDVPAGIVVFFVAVPLCLGIALASGAPLFSGLIAGIVGGIVVGAISNSSLGVSGPAAGLTVIVFTAIQQLGSFQVFLTAVILAGLMQILLGVFRAGIIAYYFPSAVIKGMLTAIGLIIILKQIPHALGYDADYEGDFSFVQADGYNTFSELVHMLDAITPGAIVISIISLTILFLWEAHLTKKYAFLKLVQGTLGGRDCWNCLSTYYSCLLSPMVVKSTTFGKRSGSGKFEGIFCAIYDTKFQRDESTRRLDSSHHVRYCSQPGIPFINRSD